ncbi:MAG: acetaldehyde dehydrogenase (acetylating) [Chloroflexi bacterium]|nr:acetaldehyde dehydrogenase (acetylating) [Chloroflexota bacterium]
MEKIKIGLIGPGNIGRDLLVKIMRSEYLEPELVINVFESGGIQFAREHGIHTSIEGIKGLLPYDNIDIVFDCTSATAHLEHAPILKEKGIFALDLTPAAVGPYCVPAVNLTDEMLDLPNLNLVTCAGQAIVPIVAAINSVVQIEYAELIASIASKSAGAGTRANIDEFTQTTRRAMVDVGGAKSGKAIIILNPAEPPINMRNTLHAKVSHADIDEVRHAVDEMVKKIQVYVPEYTAILEPIMKDDIITTMIQVVGRGDYLPTYAGNLDIITSAAVNIAEAYAKKKLGVK